MDWIKWKNMKKTGGYKRKMKKKRQSIITNLKTTLTQGISVNRSEVTSANFSSGSVEITNVTEKKTSTAESENMHVDVGGVVEDSSVQEMELQFNADESSGSEDLDDLGMIVSIVSIHTKLTFL